VVRKNIARPPFRHSARIQRIPDIAPLGSSDARASVAAAMAVNPGVRANVRKA